MKKLVITILFLITQTSLLVGQQENRNEDFFEYSIRISKLRTSSFLENSTFQDQLNDPAIDDLGLMPSFTGINYAMKFKYGKSLSSDVNLLTELGYAHRNEQVIAFCHVCGFIPKPSTVAKVKSIDLGTGIRYHIEEIEKINFSIDIMLNYSFVINESDIWYLGYYISPLIEYKLDDNWRFNFNAGFEQSFKKYQKTELFLGFGTSYYLVKK